MWPLVGIEVCISRDYVVLCLCDYRNSGNFHCHVIFVAIQKKKTKIRNLKIHFYIGFQYKLKTMKITNT